MALKASEIDISENRLRNRGRVLDILLGARGTKQNIIWATDSYVLLGKDYAPKRQIKRELITNGHGKLIRPRAAKSKEEQKYRTKVKAEVFTPLKIVKQMNDAIVHNLDLPQNHTWQDFVTTKWLEIACGEGPFIVSRYNPTVHGAHLKNVKDRVGFLDMKLQSVNANVTNKEDWLYYAEIALKSSYGYEWQGDNLLITRENVLLTLDDFYKDFCTRKLRLKSKQSLTDEQLEYFAEIISWNFWQMDGTKYVRPMSCKQTVQSATEIPKNQMSLLPPEKPQKIKVECEGCRTGNPFTHTGVYARIMNWDTNKVLRFVDL